MLERILMELSSTNETNEKKKEWSKRMESLLLDHSDWSALLEIKRMSEGVPAACLVANNLLHRKLYREACTVYMRDMTAGNVGALRHTYSSKEQHSPKNRLTALRQLEADFKLSPGSLAMYCPQAGMNAKIPEVSIHLDGSTETYRDWNQKHNEILDNGLITAQLKRFDNLWRVHFFMVADEWDNWSAKRRTVFQKAVKFLVLNIRESDEYTPEMMTEELARELTLTPDGPYFKETMVAAAQWQPKPDLKYPSGAPAIRAFFPNVSE